jgi:archaellum component FlaC
MEVEERVRNLEKEMSRIKAVESKVGQIEARLASLGKIAGGGLEEAIKLLDGKSSVIESMVEEIRTTMNVLNEQLGEFKKREIEIIRTIKEFRGNK